jgi:GTP-binding protein EngB required for normal cell division
MLNSFWLGRLVSQMDEIRVRAGLAADASSVHNADLGTICVVGDEGVGKTSIVEMMIGKKFLLPTDATNKSTRRPVRIQLRYREAHNIPTIRLQLPSNEDIETNDEACILQALLCDFESIKMSGYGIGLEEAIITINNAEVPNVDIIDLPGVINVSGKDEPSTLPNTIKQLMLNCIKDAIIVHVMDASARESQCLTLGLLKHLSLNIVTVLTKPDRVYSCEEFVTRLTRSVNVVAMQSDETKFFEEMFGQERSAFLAPRLGLGALFKMLSDKSEANCLENWKHNELARLEPEIVLYREQLEKLGPALNSKQIAGIVTHEVFSGLHVFLLLMDEAWAAADLKLPESGISEYCTTVPISGFLDKFEEFLIARLSKCFQDPKLQLARFTRFQTQLLANVRSTFRKQRDAVLLRWSQLHEHIMNVRDGLPGQYYVTHWKHAACSCVVQNVMYQMTSAQPDDTIPTHMMRFMSQFPATESEEIVEERGVVARKMAALQTIVKLLS